MRALQFERSVPRIAGARVVSAVAAAVGGAGAPALASTVRPLRLAEVDPLALPGPGWQRLRPRLAGICGSDLATVDGAASRWFEPLVSFPFVPGHEIVGELDDGSRVVVEPVLGCEARGIDPPCPACVTRDLSRCRNIAVGHLAPGLQTGYCTDTGGGWSAGLVAHDSQLHPVPEAMSDEAAVMVEPTACAIRGAFKAVHAHSDHNVIVVIGAGTLGLCTVAALARWTMPGTLVAVAKHPEQRALAKDLGATAVITPDEVRRGVRRASGSGAVTDGDGTIDRLSGGADVVIDAVGSADSLASALAVTRPGGRIVLLGMPGSVTVDLTPLWQREIELVGSYAYGTELFSPAGYRPPASGGDGHRTFDLAFTLVADAGLERLVSATYPLDRYADALAHAGDAGRRGAVKVAFDLRGEK